VALLHAASGNGDRSTCKHANSSRAQVNLLMSQLTERSLNYNNISIIPDILCLLPSFIDADYL